MKQIKDTTQVNAALVQPVKLLKELGFIYNSDDIEYYAYDIEAAYDNGFIMVEKEFSRNRLAVELDGGADGLHRDGCYNYIVYAQVDAGCGWVELPFRWSQLGKDWLTHLKQAFELTDFK